MDFWGIDRTHSSLRLQLLKRILAVGQPADANRFMTAIPEAVTGRPLAPKEAEVLLAFVSGVRTNLSGFYDTVKPNLAAIFNSTIEIRVDDSDLLAPSASETCALRYGKCISRQVASDLAYYFATRRETSVLSKFLSLFETKWAQFESLPESQFVALYGSLLGFLEGITAAEIAENVDQAMFERISALCNSETLDAVQKRLSSLHTIFELSIPALLADAAKLSALYVSVAGSNLDSVVQFSDSQFIPLESLQPFSSTSDYSILIQEATEAHFRVLDYAVSRDKDAYYQVAFVHLSRTLGDSEIESQPLASTLGKLAADLVSDSYQRLVQIFSLLSEFIGRLDAPTAYKCARQFTKTCKTHFTDESSRIKLLYSLVNKLTADEYNIIDSTYGELSALEWVASLLSAIVAIIAEFNSSDFAALAVTTLDQKLGAVNEKVDAQIVETWGLLVPYLTGAKFMEVLELLVHVERRYKSKLSHAVKKSRVTIAGKCKDGNLYFDHLLDLLVLNGDPTNTELIRNLFAPLAVLVPKVVPIKKQETLDSFRNVWFNLASLGLTTESLSPEDFRDLKSVAKWAPPLVNDDSANHIESDLQLNPVLCRDVSDNVLKVQSHALGKIMPHKVGQHSSSPRTIFMAAALLLEGLRARGGSISKLPYYFADTDIGTGQGYVQMTSLVRHLTTEYVTNLGFFPEGGLLGISSTLKELLVLACHRVAAVRHVAIEITSKIVSDIPAALCQHDALYTLLDCLTLLQESTKNSVEDEFSPKSVFTAPMSGVTLYLTDNLEVRQASLQEFERLARTWVNHIQTLLASDLRSKLYTYLGHTQNVGRGSMFALNILAASEADDDFFSQYLTLSRYDSQDVIDSPDSTIAKLKSAKTAKELQDAYTAAAPHIEKGDQHAVIIARESVRAPFRIFNDEAIIAGIIFWHHTIRHQVNLRPVIVHEVVNESILTVSHNKGLFTRDFDDVEPLWSEMEYAPTSKKKMNRHQHIVEHNLAPHTRLLNGFLRSCMHNSILLSRYYIFMFNRLAVAWLEGLRKQGSLHSLSRNLRLQVLEFSSELLRYLWALQRSSQVNRRLGTKLEKLIVRASLSWYNQPVIQWPYGSNLRHQAKTLGLLKTLAGNLANFRSPEVKLLQQLVLQEYNKLEAWYDPFGSGAAMPSEEVTSEIVQTAWQVDPHLAVQVGRVWKQTHPHTYRLLEDLVRGNLLSVCDCSEALYVYLDSQKSAKSVNPIVVFWKQVSPIESINLLSPQYASNKAIAQYALRSLQLHPITICFFYVPQIVQQLRHDQSGMVAEYILEAAKFSQKFAHQIIWNIKANMYMDDDATIPDPMKPQLDKVLKELKEQFTDDEREYYETEFKFFSEITDVSGKLKPYIKKSKVEKKQKIDEELSKIEVPKGAYLPSHPDGVVVDIDRTSGKPLQSHAKAPFIATFKIRVDADDDDDETDADNDANNDAGDGADSDADNQDNTNAHPKTKDLWQGAIFKVGDDCRQDVLALQIISVFRSIFNFCGLDVYVFPYKVTATDAGRGVIDVLPNSISRDMLGREAVNGLDQWYRSKHGGPDSIEFQKARLNFVKSMAAYSVITYLIQFKDRHNGNIMYDDDGHVIHIDFGFCFDIAPGGVRFEAAPFKLTKEMVRVMGGSPSALPFRWFEKLCVQAFLASRVFADDICRVVVPMIESGLPCFKGNTIKRLRERFVLNKTDAEAAQYMRSLISKSYESNFTRGYDEFQRLTNGIPY